MGCKRAEAGLTPEGDQPRLTGLEPRRRSDVRWLASKLPSPTLPPRRLTGLRSRPQGHASQANPTGGFVPTVADRPADNPDRNLAPAPFRGRRSAGRSHRIFRFYEAGHCQGATRVRVLTPASSARLPIFTAARRPGVRNSTSRLILQNIFLSLAAPRLTSSSRPAQFDSLTLRGKSTCIRRIVRITHSRLPRHPAL